MHPTQDNVQQTVQTPMESYISEIRNPTFEPRFADVTPPYASPVFQERQSPESPGPSGISPNTTQSESVGVAEKVSIKDTLVPSEDTSTAGFPRNG